MELLVSKPLETMWCDIEDINDIIYWNLVLTTAHSEGTSLLKKICIFKICSNYVLYLGNVKLSIPCNPAGKKGKILQAKYLLLA